MAAAYETPAAKREAFRRYLEKTGAIDTLTKGKTMRQRDLLRLTRGARRRTTSCGHSCFLLSPAVLVGLYEEPERPLNAAEYMQR